ncbi:MAG: SAM-dependent methyltransferase [Firmicutes bacterium]|nr:SAM-dependent methyltransferase [Bacillota bacterium]
MRLSPRLKTISKFVEKDTIVADIGTDHGYIPVYLIEKGIAKEVIASDVNKAPLESAKGYIIKKGLENKIETRLGNGLKVLKPREVDTVIIAGMGGILISEILSESSLIVKDIKNFILQPMVASEQLRRYLYNNNFKIIDEKLSKEDNRYYEIIKVQLGKDNIEDPIFLEIGKKLLENKDPLLDSFLAKKLKKIRTILKNIEENGNINRNDKYNKLKIKYNKIKRMKESI